MGNRAEANLSALIESTQDLLGSVDLEYRMLTFNRPFQNYIESTFGVRPELGMRPQDMISSERAKAWPAMFQRALDEGAYKMEYTLLEGRTVELSFNPIMEDGKATGISVFGKDITEWRAAEESRRFLAAIVESSEDAIFAHDREGVILTWNRGAQTVFGYTAAEVLGKPITLLVDPRESSDAKRYIERVWEGQAERMTTGSAIRKDGSRILISALSWPVRNAKGEVTAISAIVRDVTARRKAEETQGLLASIVESSNEAIHALALDGTIVSWNRGAQELMGYTGEEVVGKSAAMLLPVEDRENLKPRMGVIREGRPLAPIEIRVLHKDGHTIDVSLSGSPIRDAAGEVVGSSAIVRDMSKLKQAERELRESEERYRKTFEQAAVGIVHTTFDLCFIRCNTRFAEIVGYPIEEVPGLEVRQVTLPDEFPGNVETMRQLVDGRVESATLEKQFVHKDGSLCWAKLSISIQHDSRGQARHFIAHVEDIHSRKMAEQRLAKALDHLRASETRYRTTFQMSLDSVNLNRASDGTYIEVNEAFLKLSGYTREEVIGRTSSELNIWANLADRERMRGALQANSSFRDLEFPFLTKDGRVLWGLMSASIIEIDGLPCILSITRDVTETREAQERIALAASDLRASETRYRTVFNTSLDAISITRQSDGAYIDANKTFLESMGFTLSQLVGKTSRDLDVWVNPEDREKVIDSLRSGSGARNLEIQFKRKTGEVFSALVSVSSINLDGVPCILSIVRDLSDAKAAAEQIRTLAFYDPLTGLPNRRHVLDNVQQMLDRDARSNRKQALLFIDLDNFKTVNDTLGHRIGDLLIKETARRLLTCVGDPSAVGRLGGDEFIVTLENLSTTTEEAAERARQAGDEIVTALAEPYVLDGHACRCTASIGIVVIEQETALAVEVIQQAELAMFQAKQAGRDGLRFFAPALQAAANARAELESDLRLAIQARQFQLQYQPQVELYYQPQMARGRLVGAEALIRWKHPVRGLLAPDEFIPLAEETGLIVPLGNWVLETACAQIAAWSQNPETAHLTVAVNISARQFRSPEFVGSVMAAIADAGANPQNLKLELTESMLLENVDDVIAKMVELKLQGFRFSLDDFGTGYSSLAYLKRLPLDQLKIDISFVRDILVDSTSGAIAQTILSLGRAMNLSVIAEGVETEQQLGYLSGLGCQAFQGYLFSKPLPIHGFEAFASEFGDRAAIRRK